MKPKPQAKTSSLGDSGFTIIESLMAIVVVAMLLASITPILIISTSIRVQSRRIEKATQAANTFIDGVKAGSIVTGSSAAPSKKISLDPATLRTPADYFISITKMPVPISKTDANVNLYLLKKDGNICIASDSACQIDSTNTFDEFYIQAMPIIVAGIHTKSSGYRLAVRVYRSDVNFSKPLLASTSDVKKVVSPIVADIGNRQAPLIERTVDISHNSPRFQALCYRLGMTKDQNGNNQVC
ncbi:hormogonium polysaccharide secretion pseudopilin HpsB [Dolichospermum sp. ST_sed1]|nr:hormogonium polysaccharide secretion pseudopilin HpsB [Dolichospermum sp. ST_sed1]MDD1424749.1 hormogonium polysaccharide secretion pseudopilin HpsB [Dolichospermum sp. ST_sed9]MDD1432123.1 hormogonium polysaccharide secretion pseudopilin HpsB [Dolichospermum sp. ST_sed6]MDD1440423.1 hormogonium polysaccharide secretion pseudopilin HpsB [Dolichospermum sp. ST_sed3]MDD1446443.1 hormogonium polysaccharide secretion pseudopilin HpsB [Dolichospermum sp. ST_sed8]MDD1456845.1 hormogonium polysacc